MCSCHATYNVIIPTEALIFNFSEFDARVLKTWNNECKLGVFPRALPATKRFETKEHMLPLYDERVGVQTAEEKIFGF